MKVLYLSAELTPLAKVGGLADVAGSLPKALKNLNIDIRVMIPYYQTIEEQHIKKHKLTDRLIVPFGDKNYIVTIYQGTLPNSTVPLYLLHHHEWLSTGPIYSKKRERFMFFSQAVLEFLKHDFFAPDIIHVNDWHVAAVPLLLKKDKFFQNTKIKSLLTIHNLAMKGKVANIKTKLWHPSLYENNKKRTYNILQQGILYSDWINTVSPQYAKEILTKEYGTKLLPDLLKNKKKITGIINGIDSELFNPKNEKYAKKNYDINHLNNKKSNKAFLQYRAGFPKKDNTPLIGLVTRITLQKGIRLIVKIIPKLAKLNAQFVFTGAGKEPLENALKNAVKKYPHKFFFLNAYNLPFSQSIYSGADMFLMPSKFEPCGLGQMIAMAYGTIPIVRATGGLKDTVKDGVNGFRFDKYDANELFLAIKRALNVYEDKAKWNKMVRTAMKQDFSWKKSALEYKKLYLKLASS
ncbi:MAG: glycogen/starch synthase [Patescibacteria group bacterium]|jgi:starch synthase